MTARLPEPGPSTDVRALFLTYLDFYREIVAAKLAGLSERDLRASRLPSGWSPIELLGHLIHMERRWIVWGLAGEPVPDPWGDEGADGRWHVPSEETLDGLLARLRAGGERTRRIVTGLGLTATASAAGRFGPDGDRGEGEPPTVTAVLFHVLQEYARHAGHLDIARELVDGTEGEES